MREGGGKKDRGHQREGHGLALLDGVDDGVRVLVLGVQEMVDEPDHKARRGQKVQKPGMGKAEGRGIADAQVERRAHESPRSAGQMGDQDPFEKAARGLQDLAGLFFHGKHGQSLQK